MAGQVPAPVLQGSGKTLAFGLAIIQLLLEEQGRADDGTDTAPGAAGDDGDTADAGAAQTEGVPVGARKRLGGPLRALIVAPTRELAMQVQLPSLMWPTKQISFEL